MRFFFLCLLLPVFISSCQHTSRRGVVEARAMKPQLGAGQWISFDGKTMPYQNWIPPLQKGERLQGLLICVHGLSGAKSDFWPLGVGLAEKKYGVYAYDLRGQGNDPVVADRGDILSKRLWLRDLQTFHQLVRRRHPGQPIYWYGESLGSLICLHAAAERLRPDPQGLILASPAAGIQVTITDFQRWLLEASASVVPRTRFSLGTLAGLDESKMQVTSGTTHGSQMQKTPHCVPTFTVRLLSQIGQLLEANPQAAARLRLPLLMLASPHDILSSERQIQLLYQQLRSRRKKLLWFRCSHHLLLHDVQRQEVIFDVLSWLESRQRRRR
jgi:acylglycerol lipase